MTAMLAALDGEGVYGTFLNYALTFSFAGGAFMLFIYLWMNNRLDMDEKPKLQMLEGEEISDDT